LRRGFRLSVFTLVGFCAPRLGGQAPRRQIVVRVTESAGVPVLAAQILAYDARSAAVTTSRQTVPATDGWKYLSEQIQ
jgi:hypothetical protein